MAIDWTAWTGWNHGVLTIAAPAAVANSQHYVDLTYAAGMCSDFSDIKIVQNDGTELSYWIQPDSVVAGVSCRVYFKVVATSQASVYIFWNGVTASRSNGDNTFYFFDDFLALDTATKWTVVSGSATVSGGVLTLLRASSTDAIVQSKSQTISLDPGVVIGRVKSAHFENVTYREMYSPRYKTTTSYVDAQFCRPGSQGMMYRQYNTSLNLTSMVGWTATTWYILKCVSTGSSSNWTVDGGSAVNISNQYPTGTKGMYFTAQVADNARLDIDWVASCICDPNLSTFGGTVNPNLTVSLTDTHRAVSLTDTHRAILLEDS